jgi:hypothetical protein
MQSNAIFSAVEAESGPVLVRSLEQLLTRLLRLLVGRISLIRLLELIRNVYIREAVNLLESQTRDGRVTKTQLALMTGIDTRTIAKHMESTAFSRPMHENHEFLAEMTLETRILSVWMSDPRFFDHSRREPLSLSLTPGARSIYELISIAIGGRGLTIASILQRLESAGSVQVDEETQEVKLVTDTYYPFLTNDDSAMLDVGLSTAAALLGTVKVNMEHRVDSGENLFQRSSFTHQLAPENRSELRGLVKTFLEKADRECKSIIGAVEDEVPRHDHITAGVSMFYFEERVK